MRFVCSRLSISGLAIVFLVLAAATFPTALAAGAPDPECVEACTNQWAADKQACLDALSAKLAQIDQQFQECLAACAPSDLLCQGMCTNKANVARAAANNDYKKCVSAANSTAWNCYRGCPVSKSKP